MYNHICIIPLAQEVMFSVVLVCLSFLILSVCLSATLLTVMNGL